MCMNVYTDNTGIKRAEVPPKGYYPMRNTSASFRIVLYATEIYYFSATAA